MQNGGMVGNLIERGLQEQVTQVTSGILMMLPRLGESTALMSARQQVVKMIYMMNAF